MNEPCVLGIEVSSYNEEKPLAPCLERVLAMRSGDLDLDVDDCSTDQSLTLARRLEQAHPEIRVLAHPLNKGKGAPLRTGFQVATGDLVAVQDADLEYAPRDLIELLKPLRQEKADVVLGSRFLCTGAHRVLYFWHSLSNGIDLFIAASLIRYELAAPLTAKCLSLLAIFAFNFLGRKYLVFPERTVGEWRLCPQPAG